MTLFTDLLKLFLSAFVPPGINTRFHLLGLRSMSSSTNMGTQGTGRKRAPLKDRFSAEDEALSSIAREVRSFITYINFEAYCNEPGMLSP